jgi:hypothetical protein
MADDKSEDVLHVLAPGKEEITPEQGKVFNIQGVMLDMPQTMVEHGEVFSNRGELVEEGGKYFDRESATYIVKSNKKSFRGKGMSAGGDPILQWEGINIVTAKVEHYESSRALRLGVGNLNTGSNYEEYDRAPSVNTWLGRSWVEGEYEELYFLVENREMLDAVAEYYGLPIPYGDDLKATLDNDLQSIRFKSYDLNNAGEGNFVAVVVSGIVFEGNKGTSLKLYSLKRMNE